MIKYREHRGSLDESLATSMEFETLKKLFDYIVDKHLPSQIYIINTNINYYGFDERCNQQLFTVSNKDFGVFGFIYEDVI